MAPQRRGGGLVDQTFHANARKRARALGRRPLRHVEVGGNAHHRLVHTLAQKLLRVRHQLAYDARGQRFRREAAPAQVVHRVGAHLALEARDGILGLRHQPFLGDTTHHGAAVLVHAYHAGGKELAKLVGHQLRAPVFVYRRQAVGCAQVYAHDRHMRSLQPTAIR